MMKICMLSPIKDRIHLIVTEMIMLEKKVKPIANLWIRSLYMLVLFISAYLVAPLIIFIGLFQLISHAVLGKGNQNLSSFASILSDYIADVARFLTFTTDKIPYPFSSNEDN